MTTYIASKLVPVIMQAEPKLQSSLESALIALRTKNPQQAAMFLEQWNKLNASVQRAIASPSVGVAPSLPAYQSAARRKRTRRTRR